MKNCCFKKVLHLPFLLLPRRGEGLALHGVAVAQVRVAAAQGAEYSDQIPADLKNESVGASKDFLFGIFVDTWGRNDEPNLTIRA